MGGSAGGDEGGEAAAAVVVWPGVYAVLNPAGLAVGSNVSAEARDGGRIAGGAFLGTGGVGTQAAEALLDAPASLAALALSASVFPAAHDPRLGSFHANPPFFLVTFIAAASAGVGAGAPPQTSLVTHSLAGFTALVCQKLSIAVAPMIGRGGGAGAA